MIMGMASEGESAAVIEVCKSLSEMFRYNLNGGHMVSLREELDQTKRYVRISQYRFRELFTVEYYVAEGLLNQCVPKMILQPLVENSVIHGFAESGKQGVLTISVSKIPGDMMLVCVKDTGCGMLKNDLNVLRDSLIDTSAFPGEWAHVGINNVYARLRMEYGAEVQFDIDSRVEAGTQITIILPIRRESEE
jgi:two-component system sensor histidine kinase YesM